MSYINSATIWITVANLLYLASYSVHDILYLRVLSVLGALLLVPYYYLQSAPLWTAIAWNLLFVAINVFWIVRLAIERRPVRLTADEQRLRELSFPSLTPREARNLYAQGVWDDMQPGSSIVQHDRRQKRFSVILSGLADVEWDGKKVGELGEGQFVGDLDSRADAVGNIDVIVRAPTRVMCWARERLNAFLKDRPDVALALERSVGLELRHRLDTALSKDAGA